MVVSLLVDGSPVIPLFGGDELFLFRLILPVQEIRLVSGYARPTDFGASDDHRFIGIAVFGVRWQNEWSQVNYPIDTPAFLDGFHHLEWDGANREPFRWTTGNAALPPGAIPPWQGNVLLHLRLKSWHGSAVPPRRDPATILAEFQSLGCNCEFGLAQRHCGVEPPLSLLRWGGTTFEKLLLGLQSRLGGLGDPDTTAVEWDTTDYRLRTPYLRIHTNTIERVDEAGETEIFETGCVTLRLLRRKLLRDIADSRLIFVFRSEDAPMEHGDMRNLHAAMREIGPASLLCVTLKRLAHTGGDLQVLGDGLYAGYLDRFVIPDGPWDTWLDLCSRALELHREHQSQ